MTSLARQERAALLVRLADAGPDAPTLCGDWTTHDLAAHLVVRERQPYAVPGMVVEALQRPTAWLEGRARQRAYEDLLARLRRGAPPWSPVGSPVAAVYDAANVHEFYVHHEDVRRAAGLGARTLGPELEAALWVRSRVLAPLFLRRVRGVRVELVTPAGRSLVARRGEGHVTVRGEVGELFLWLYGREADVVVEGTGLEGVRVGP
ncbi:MAG: hypothetical protein JWO60_1738 [Frankiales bacterium]|nr:hypothetical protein [Frankiales bacterium]